MKLIVGAAFALGVVLGGGPTLATHLVADDVSSVDEPAPTTDPADPDDSDDSTESDDPKDEGTDGPAEVNYGHLVTAWLGCSKSDDATECGTRPHPPGVAKGFDAAHSKGHAKSAHGKGARH